MKGVPEPEAPPGATAEDAARLHRAVVEKGTVRGKGVTLPFGAMLQVQREQEQQEQRLKGEDDAPPPPPSLSRPPAPGRESRYSLAPPLFPGRASGSSDRHGSSCGGGDEAGAGA